MQPNLSSSSYLATLMASLPTEDPEMNAESILDGHLSRVWWEEKNIFPIFPAQYFPFQNDHQKRQISRRTQDVSVRQRETASLNVHGALGSNTLKNPDQVAVFNVHAALGSNTFKNHDQKAALSNALENEDHITGSNVHRALKDNDVNFSEISNNLADFDRRNCAGNKVGRSGEFFGDGFIFDGVDHLESVKRDLVCEEVCVSSSGTSTSFGSALKPFQSYNQLYLPQSNIAKNRPNSTARLSNHSSDQNYEFCQNLHLSRITPAFHQKLQPKSTQIPQQSSPTTPQPRDQNSFFVPPSCVSSNSTKPSQTPRISTADSFGSALGLVESTNRPNRSDLRLAKSPRVANKTVGAPKEFKVEVEGLQRVRCSWCDSRETSDNEDDPVFAQQETTLFSTSKLHKDDKSTSEKHTTVVGYYYLDDPVPYRTFISGRNPTLAHFKQLLNKKGNLKYYFKRESDEFNSGVVNEEISDDLAPLPLYQGKIIGKIELKQ